ncbi:MAG TPA: hypothetical protein VFF17_02345 [Thermoanaerobaculia bacterium]|nr:hypothetical protein [Thermoanaerobaculia bacterium]
MNVNLQAWDNFLGRSLIVFLVIEGLKTFPWVARAARGSIFYKFVLNVGVTLAFAVLVRGTGSDFFLGDGVTPLVLSVIFGSLVTAGLHRLKMAFERRSPYEWAQEHARRAV